MSAQPPPFGSAVTVEAVQRLATQRQNLLTELGKAVVGQLEVIDNVLLTVFCGGHGLIEGVPGLAKTLLIRSLGRVLDLRFSRIQFTPDLMPSDITGTDVLEEDHETGRRKQVFLPGPVFANLILADEINRTPPKTQAAMLQVMQEREVTIGNKTYPLPHPFHVFATQNPIEQEGTYVLPEAQADRFMFHIRTTYPTRAEEELVVRATTGTDVPDLRPVLTAEEIVNIQKLVRAMPVSDEVIRYAVRLVAATRPEEVGAPSYVKEFIRWGASPRASQYLILGAKARAAVTGRLCADYEGVRSVARQVFRHRVLANFNARAQKVTVSDLIERMLKEVTPEGK
ncbi:MAG TPA: MoxR family ATPase [Verrucomicrobiota bacterium]|nr:AAA family ATPase [Verrucomicrobiales bacterium]HRI14847.1 MoxR family ATPase [Verrucomicrobiota bacterium]